MGGEEVSTFADLEADQERSRNEQSSFFNPPVLCEQVLPFPNGADCKGGLRAFSGCDSLRFAKTPRSQIMVWTEVTAQVSARWAALCQ